jgi:hypothetical protein
MNNIFLRPRFEIFKYSFKEFYFKVSRQMKGRFKKRVSILWPRQRNLLLKNKFVSQNNVIIRNQLYYLFFYDFLLNRILHVLIARKMSVGFD